MNSKIMSNKYYVFGLALLSVFLWGSAFPTVKVTYRELNILVTDTPSRLVLAGIRFLAAGIIVLIVAAFIDKKVKVPKMSTMGQFFMLGVISTTVQYFFFYNGLARTSPVKGSILATSGTFFTIIIAHFIYKNDKLNWSKVLGLLFGIIGIFVTNWKKVSGGMTMDFNVLGEGFLIMAGLSSAFATFYAKKLGKDNNPINMTGWQLAMGGIVLIVLGLLTGQEFKLNFTPLAYVLLIYSAFLSAIAITVWFTLLKFNPAGKITVFKFLIPVFGSTLSTIFLPDQSFTVTIVIGLVCASAGIYMVNRKKVQVNK